MADPFFRAPLWIPARSCIREPVHPPIGPSSLERAWEKRTGGSIHAAQCLLSSTLLYIRYFCSAPRRGAACGKNCRDRSGTLTGKGSIFTLSHPFESLRVSASSALRVQRERSISVCYDFCFVSFFFFFFSNCFRQSASYYAE